MIVTKSKKKKLIIAGTTASVVAVVTGATVGGYFLSSNLNGFLEYAKGPINNTVEAFKAVYYSYLINNSHMMVLPGFTLKPSMVSALKEYQYNDAAFLLVDDTYGDEIGKPGIGEESTSQVAAAVFRNDQGSFVTGIAIAQYLNENKSYFLENDGKLTWGTYGGLPFSSVMAFMTGVQLGIAWFNTYIAANNDDILPIEQISTERIFAGSFGPNDGDDIINLYLQTDIDCLMPVAGPQTLTAINKIVAKNKRTIVVGVDSPIENDHIAKTKKLPTSPDMPKEGLVGVFSSLKNTGLITYNVLENIKAGKSYEETLVPGNNIGGLGYKSLGTIDNGCVGVSGNGKEYFTNALKKYDPTINSYESAVNKIIDEPIYKKLNQDGYRTFIPFGNVNSSESFDIQKFENYSLNPKYKTYDKLLEQGEALKKLDKEVPKHLIDNFTQQQWDYKKTAPERMQKILSKETNYNFANEIKVILSTPTSVLLDGSFSQSCYDGIASFYNKYDVKIKYTNSTQALIDEINRSSSLFKKFYEYIK